MRLLEGRMHRHHQMTSYNHLVEIFGGCHALTRGMRERGYEAEVFDIRVNSDHNIHVEEGLMTLCRMLVRTAPRRSVVGIQPTYTSWVNEQISLRQVVARLYNIIYFSMVYVKGPGFSMKVSPVWLSPSFWIFWNWAICFLRCWLETRVPSMYWLAMEQPSCLSKLYYHSWTGSTLVTSSSSWYLSCS